MKTTTMEWEPHPPREKTASDVAADSHSNTWSDLTNDYQPSFRTRSGSGIGSVLTSEFLASSTALKGSQVLAVTGKKDGEQKNEMILMMMDDDMDHNHTSAGRQFCSSDMSGGMIMYMDGFRFSLRGAHHHSFSPPPCLNFLLPHWTLDSPDKFVAAMMATFALAVLAEGLAKFRLGWARQARVRRRANHARRNIRTRGETTTTTANNSSNTSGYDRLFLSLLHGLQALLGYMIMLVTMTFSVELLICVVTGLTTGYAIFYQRSHLSDCCGPRRRPTRADDDNHQGHFLSHVWSTLGATAAVTGAPDDDGAVYEVRDQDEEDDAFRHVTNNPCCEFLAAEAQDLHRPPPSRPEDCDPRQPEEATISLSRSTPEREPLLAGTTGR